MDSGLNQRAFFLESQVFHGRQESSENAFHYPVLNIYFAADLQEKLDYFFKRHFFRYLGIKSQNYLNLKKINLYSEARDFVCERFQYKADEIFLQTMPKMFGYVFNPVSFWYFFKTQNSERSLDAVLCEVNNTFGEKHYYWLHQEGLDLNNLWLEAAKEFHVSPFFAVDGFYKFKFSINSEKIEATINLYNADKNLKLATWIKGQLKPLSSLSLLQVLLRYGWMTPLVVMRIHYQAVKLFMKKVRFYSKPNPPSEEVTRGTRIDSI